MFRTGLCLCLMLGLAAADAPPEPEVVAELTTPIMLDWPAGTYRLSDMLDRLQRAGDHSLARLGLDDTARRELPAFSGSYWAAVLQVARTYDLAVVPGGRRPAGDDTNQSDLHARLVFIGERRRQPRDLPPIAIGAPRLSESPQATAPRLHPAGAILLRLADHQVITGRTLHGAQRWIRFDLTAVFQPGTPDAAIRQADFSWHPSSNATPVDPADATPLFHHFVATDGPAPGNAIRCHFRVTGDAPVALSGQLDLICARPLQITTTLEPDLLLTHKLAGRRYRFYWRTDQAEENADSPPFWVPHNAIAVAIDPHPPAGDRDRPQLELLFGDRTDEVPLTRLQSQTAPEELRCTFRVRQPQALPRLRVRLTDFGPEVTTAIPFTLELDGP